MSSLPVGSGWLGFIILAFVIGLMARGQGGGRYIHVPKGQRWQSVYLRHIKPKPRQPSRWLLFGFCVGLWPLLQRFLAWLERRVDMRQETMIIGLIAAVLLFCLTVGLMFWTLRHHKSPLSAEERQQQLLRRQAAKEEAARLARIRRKARVLRPQVIDGLASFGFNRVIERKGAMRRYAKPEIQLILYGHESIWMRLHALPWPHKFTALLDPDIAQNLSLKLQRECTFHARHDLGVWLEIYLKSGIAGIPKFFPWYDAGNAQNAYDLLLKGKRRRHTFALGMGENRKFWYEDLRDGPHWLVAGATKGGKSVFLNQLICTLLKRNQPAQLKLVLIDLKRGLEFRPYRAVPHLWRGVVTDVEEVPTVVTAVQREMDRRFDLLSEADCVDIDEYNKQQQPYGRLPILVVVFDEIARLMQDRALKETVEQLVSNLAEQARAAGIHLVLCTQYPNKDVITSRIKANIPKRIAFATDPNGSRVILGNEAASQLKPVTGQMLFKDGVQLVRLQAPFISREQVKETIQIVSASDVDNGIMEITPMILFQRSLDKYKGEFSIRAIYNEFRNMGVSEGFVRQVGREYEYNFEQQGPIFDVNDGQYILAPPQYPRRPRMLKPIYKTPPQSLEDIYDVIKEE